MVKAEWENLAYCMRYRPVEVEAFRKDSKDLSECCERLLADWITTTHGPKPKTYKNLLKYIKKIDMLGAASVIIEKNLIEGKGNKICNMQEIYRMYVALLQSFKGEDMWVSNNIYYV